MNFRPEVASSRSYKRAVEDVSKEGEYVVLFGSRANIFPVLLESGKITNNKFGAFHHNHLIGQRFGSRFKGERQMRHGRRVEASVILLKMTADLWTNALPHRTQVIYSADISLICARLNLSSGCIVLESGTGSGSLSANIMRSIAPRGHLHTFEFNKERAIGARIEFERLKLSELVTVRRRDIVKFGFVTRFTDDDAKCGDSLAVTDSTTAVEDSRGKRKRKRAEVDDEIVLRESADLPLSGKLTDDASMHHFDDESIVSGCIKATVSHSDAEESSEANDEFVCERESVDAIFLDLPSPATVIQKVSTKEVLKVNGMICSFSPCIEQTQASCLALIKGGFVAICTVEILSKDYLIRPFAPAKIDFSRDYGLLKAKRRGWDKAVEKAAESSEMCSPTTRVAARTVRTSFGHTGFLTFARKPQSAALL